MILMKYHSFFSKIRKDVKNVSSAADVIGTLRVKMIQVYCRTSQE